jgi:hypothetical protein
MGRRQEIRKVKSLKGPERKNNTAISPCFNITLHISSLIKSLFRMKRQVLHYDEILPELRKFEQGKSLLSGNNMKITRKKDLNK